MIENSYGNTTNGTKYSQVDISSFPRYFTILSLKTITINNKISDKVEVIIKPKANILIASSSFLGNIIANSYLPFAIEPKIDTIAKNNANTPKSFGV